MCHHETRCASLDGGTYRHAIWHQCSNGSASCSVNPATVVQCALFAVTFCYCYTTASARLLLFVRLPGKLLVRYYGEHSSSWVAPKQLLLWGASNEAEKVEALKAWGKKTNRYEHMLSVMIHDGSCNTTGHLQLLCMSHSCPLSNCWKHTVVLWVACLLQGKACCGHCC